MLIRDPSCEFTAETNFGGSASMFRYRQVEDTRSYFLMTYPLVTHLLLFRMTAHVMLTVI